MGRAHRVGMRVRAGSPDRAARTPTRIRRRSLWGAPLRGQGMGAGTLARPQANPRRPPKSSTEYSRACSERPLPRCPGKDPSRGFPRAAEPIVVQNRLQDLRSLFFAGSAAVRAGDGEFVEAIS